MSTPATETPRRHPVRVGEFLRMAEGGVLEPEARIELIEGELFDMAPIGPRHAGKVNRLVQEFARALTPRALVAAQNPVVLGDFSAPQPDIALLRPRPDFYEGGHPGPADILALVEVADATLEHDRTRKLPLYARFGVPEVWLVDVAGGRLEVHRHPHGDAYATRFQPDDLSRLELAALPGRALDLAGLV